MDDVLANPTQLVAVLEECGRTLGEMAHSRSEAKPDWFATHIIRTATKAARAVVCAADHRFGDWGDLPLKFQWFRDPNRKPITVRYISRDGKVVELYPVTNIQFGSGFNMDGSLPDDTALHLWKGVLCPFLRNRSKVSHARAGVFDFPEVLTDEHGQLLGRDGKPLGSVEITNPASGGTVRRYAALITDYYSDAEHIEHMRAIAADSADVCRIASAIIGAQPSPIQSGRVTGTKKSSTPGDADEKILAALCTYHGYHDGGADNMEPIGGNELARQAGVSKGAVTGFWKRRFRKGAEDGSIKDYRIACRNGTLTLKLAFWRGEIPAEGAIQLLTENILAGD
jgi:hypothetical protein